MIIEQPLEGRRAIITGASRGIGRAIAEQLARAGADVALIARSRGELEQVAAAIRSDGGTAIPIVADLGRDDPAEVARRLVKGMHQVREHRRHRNDSYSFNWLLSIGPELQQPFAVTHASMRALDLSRDQPVHLLAANLRRAFSGIVTGNVKENGIKAIEAQGPFELHAESSMARLLDELLTAFVVQRRMKLPGSTYRPVYRLVA